MTGLAGDRHPPTITVVFYVFTRLQLVELKPPLGIGHVLVETAAGVLRGGDVDLAIRIHAPEALGDFCRVCRLEQ